MDKSLLVIFWPTLYVDPLHLRLWWYVVRSAAVCVGLRE